MTPSRKLASFAAVLGVAFGGGAVLGDAVGPIDVGSGNDDMSHGDGGEAHAAEAGDAEHAGGGGGATTTAPTSTTTAPGGTTTTTMPAGDEHAAHPDQQAEAGAEGAGGTGGTGGEFDWSGVSTAAREAWDTWVAWLDWLDAQDGTDDGQGVGG